MERMYSGKIVYKEIFSGGSGRRDKKELNPVIGHVILHDKLEAWTEKATKSHYHQGQSAKISNKAYNILCQFVA